MRSKWFLQLPLVKELLFLMRLGCENQVKTSPDLIYCLHNILFNDFQVDFSKFE